MKSETVCGSIIVDSYEGRCLNEGQIKDWNIEKPTCFALDMKFVQNGDLTREITSWG